VHIDRAVLTALAVAGLLWVFGLCLMTLMSSPTVIAAGVAYVVVFGVALASPRFPTVPTLVAAWASAVVAASAFMHVVDGEVGAVIFLGGVLGTFLFGAWVVPGFCILLVIDPDMRTLPD
jgi:hypothetical protein